MALADHIKGAIHKLSERHSKKHEKPLEKKKEKHIGFKGAEDKVEHEGYSKKIAGAIIASAARHASPAAKKANTHLKRVKG